MILRLGLVLPLLITAACASEAERREDATKAPEPPAATSLRSELPGCSDGG